MIKTEYLIGLRDCPTCNGTAGIYGCSVHSPYSQKPTDNYVTYDALAQMLGDIQLRCPVCHEIVRNRDYSEHRKKHLELVK